jgi:sphingosine kinase
MDLSKYETTTNTYTSFLTFTWAMIADLDIESEVVRFLGSFRLDLWGAICVARNRKYRGRLSYLPPSTKEEEEDATHKLTMPALTDPVPSNWTVLEDDIILLWASQVTHASEGNYSSPPSHIQDGVFQIMLVRGRHVGRLALATILLSLDSGGHATHPAVEFVTCVAYRLEPLSTGSYNDLDGEIIESGPVQGQVMPNALQVFCNIPANP